MNALDQDAVQAAAHLVGRTGARNSQWKGGRVTDPRGYVLLRRPDHRLADVRGYVYEHRIVAERIIGRPLRAGEIVHHLDEDKSNNDPANLVVLPSRRHHGAEHRRNDLGWRQPDEPNPVVECACGCGRSLARYDRWRRPRRFITGHNLRVVSNG